MKLKLTLLAVISLSSVCLAHGGCAVAVAEEGAAVIEAQPQQGAELRQILRQIHTTGEGWPEFLARVTPPFDRYFRHYGIDIFQDREDLIQDTLLSLLETGIAKIVAEMGDRDPMRLIYRVANRRRIDSVRRKVRHNNYFLDADLVKDGERKSEEEASSVDKIRVYDLPSDVLDILTQDQKNVLVKAHNGKTIREIAQELGMSPKDVKYHLFHAELSVSKQTGIVPSVLVVTPHTIEKDWKLIRNHFLSEAGGHKPVREQQLRYLHLALVEMRGDDAIRKTLGLKDRQDVYNLRHATLERLFRLWGIGKTKVGAGRKNTSLPNLVVMGDGKFIYLESSDEEADGHPNQN
ncbi:MAG: sigma-70 family RNA polymerase sigma factor [Deltaproteobacteria bacterium]|nr:sigma-70 family RNA polymerase sigma factor [Deltaproteobacteria bacterium]